MKKKLSVSIISMVVLLVISVILSGCGSDKTTAESKTSFDACIDAPASGATISTANYNVKGWFLDATGVSKVEIQIDDTTLGEAAYGDSRPDVQKAYPDYNNTNSGFHYILDITALTNGSHSLTALETNSAGKTSSKKVSFTIAKSPEALVIGKWTSGGDSIEFNQKGEVTSIENGKQNKYTYKLAAIAGSKDSTTISITDSDGTSSSETVVFKDENTMVIGDTTVKRVIAKAANANTNVTDAKTANTKAAVQETITFSDPAYLVSFKYPASMRIDLMQNNTIQLTSKINDTYFIRCEQKFLQDSLNKGLTYEGATKDFIKIAVDNLKKVDVISNYKEGSSANSDGSAFAEAIFNAQTSSGYWKVRIQATAMGKYILVTTIWSHDNIYDNAVKELKSILDTLAIK